MKLLPFALASLLFATPAFAQKTSDKLPPANPIAYEDQDAAAVLNTVNAALATLESSDTATLRSLLQPEGGVAVAVELPDGSRRFKHLSWDEYIAKLAPDGHRYSEAISNPAVEIDGDIAMVWAAYRVTQDGKLMHCGYDHFDLVRVEGKWKILNITWSQRTQGCPA
ncbi:nuclear transport factor 2 family protein [Sphingomonas sp.]|uniref:nuclear transport factor 2 family protein n=1 Tax=Sphingomonas sp. TaxID=28214 RepID=UPI001B1B6B4C|nr:nuclear transport factor 2 family protein [Sphingomonas sp.]MBO9712051.1 nuclear transport factor 2 family protein [Sphingomonas sp.]